MTELLLSAIKTVDLSRGCGTPTKEEQKFHNINHVDLLDNPVYDRMEARHYC